MFRHNLNKFAGIFYLIRSTAAHLRRSDADSVQYRPDPPTLPLALNLGISMLINRITQAVKKTLALDPF
jgi:hypothetical protein